MDGVSALSTSAADTAAAGSSMVAMSVLKQTQNLMAAEMDRLMASLGVGTAVNALA